jgi:hypothetical protein
MKGILNMRMVAIASSLLTMVITGVTGYAFYCWSFYVHHPGSLAGGIEKTIAIYVHLAAIGLVLINFGLIWLASRSPRLPRAWSRVNYGVLGAIALANGLSLCIPWLWR